MIDFGEVVIFGCEPEDGGVRLVVFRREAGPGESGCCLERCKERSTEKADLLTGDDDAGASAQ